MVHFPWHAVEFGVIPGIRTELERKNLMFLPLCRDQIAVTKERILKPLIEDAVFDFCDAAPALSTNHIYSNDGVKDGTLKR